MRALIVEDNAKLAEYVIIGAGRHGIALDWVSTTSEADAALATVDYEAIVLDLGLPDRDGSDWLKERRRNGDSRPILVLTARDSVDDAARNLDIGADDYIRKPFELAELFARLRAVTRRPGSMLSSLIVEGNVALDVNLREIRVGEVPIAIGRREVSCLEVLLRRAGRVVTKASLEEAIYSLDDQVSANAVEVLVHRLRKHLTDAGATTTIHTLRGVGYVLSDKRE